VRRGGGVAIISIELAKIVFFAAIVLFAISAKSLFAVGVNLWRVPMRGGRSRHFFEP
jgi:hypothetical protein